MDPLSVVIPRIHREGFRFIVVFGVVTLVLFFIWEPLGWLGLVATVWCLYFFRDPERFTPIGDGLIIAPADGVVCTIGLATPPAELDFPGGEMMRIGIFMNVFNCHVNRMPIDGTVIKSVYHPGKFLNASFDKASEENERQALAVESHGGQRIGVVQIAGLVARRIVCQCREGDKVNAGEKFGIIRFGSRVDVYVAPEATLLVVQGQTMTAGETVLADLTSDQPTRQARMT